MDSANWIAGTFGGAYPDSGFNMSYPITGPDGGGVCHIEPLGSWVTGFRPTSMSFFINFQSDDGSSDDIYAQVRETNGTTYRSVATTIEGGVYVTVDTSSITTDIDEVKFFGIVTASATNHGDFMSVNYISYET